MYPKLIFSQMNYAQQAPPRKSGGGGGGCLTACLAALCCCCVAEEGCEACADCAGTLYFPQRIPKELILINLQSAVRDAAKRIANEQLRPEPSPLLCHHLQNRPHHSGGRNFGVDDGSTLKGWDM